MVIYGPSVLTVLVAGMVPFLNHDGTVNSHFLGCFQPGEPEPEEE